MSNIFEKASALLIALIFLSPGCYKIYSFLSFKQHSVSLTGTVVKQGMGRYLGCRPFIEFNDEQGVTMVMKSEVNYYFFSCPRIGDEIEILHNELTPEKNITVNITHYLVIPIIMISIGLLTVYVVIVKKSRRTKRDSTTH
jgi:hypothetical protein